MDSYDRLIGKTLFEMKFNYYDNALREYSKLSFDGNITCSFVSIGDAYPYSNIFSPVSNEYNSCLSIGL